MNHYRVRDVQGESSAQHALDDLHETITKIEERLTNIETRVKAIETNLKSSPPKDDH
jgi:predicted  nucleic acid-binding Zn-ribbon protein